MRKIHSFQRSKETVCSIRLGPLTENNSPFPSGGWNAEPGIYIIQRDGEACEEIVKNTFGTLAWSPDGKELLYPKPVDGSDLLFKMDLDSRTETLLARIGPRKHRNGNIGWDWFDPSTLPVSPQPQLLTTVWGQMKIQD